MKYTSILAGAFGLMVLAACTNNDEVKMEQPQVARTITATWGNNADTRLGLMFKELDKPITSYWEQDDELGVAIDPGVNVITYKTTVETSSLNNSATFTLVGDTGPVAGEKYVVCYPKSYATQGLNFVLQTGEFKHLYKYAYAMAMDVTFTENEPDTKVTLEPFTSYLVIPEGTVFPGLKNYVLPEGSEDEFFFRFDGLDLTSVIDWENGPNTDPIIISKEAAGASTDKSFIKRNSDGEFVAGFDIYIAVPLTENMTELSLYVCLDAEGFEVQYWIVKDPSAEDPEDAIIEPGHFYDLSGHLWHYVPKPT